MTPAAIDLPQPVAPRRPRDAQRRRVYLAETPLPSSPLPGLDACARYVDRVVGTLWWHERFPERDRGGVPRARCPCRASTTSGTRRTPALRMGRTPAPREGPVAHRVDDRRR